MPLSKAETFDVTLSSPVYSEISAYLTRIKEPTRVPYELSGHKLYLVSCNP